MSSSPRFWQKLGLGKQNKSSTSSSTVKSVEKQDSNFIHSSISFHNLHEAAKLDHNVGERQVKRFSSNISLQHRASSASLRQQITQQPLPEKQIRRTSYMKPLRKIDPEDSTSYYSKLNENVTHPHYDQNDSISPGSDKRTLSSCNTRDSTDLQSQRKPSISCLPQIQQPTRRQSIMDIRNYKNTSAIPNATTTTNVNRLPNSTANLPSIDDQQQQQQKSSPSNNSNGSRLRQPSPAVSHAKPLSRSGSNNSLSSSVATTMPKKKSIPKLKPSQSVGEDDNTDNKSCLTRSSSNGSNSTNNVEKNGKRRSSLEKRKSKQQMMGEQNTSGGGDFIVEMLKAELEKERASSRNLQGQKEAIAKDLDYFCTLVDEVTEDKDKMKEKYEQEKIEHDKLKKVIESLQLQQQDIRGAPHQGAQTVAQLRSELEAMQQQATEDQYVYYNNLQFKNDEINKLKFDLKQAQSQIKILRKTMEQMLKADGRDIYEDNDFISVDDGIRSRKSSTIFDNDHGGEKYLLLQSGYQPDNLSVTSATSAKSHNISKPGTNPPSPMPCYSLSNNIANEELGSTTGASDHLNDDDDILSTTSKDSYHSGGNYRQYEFLKYDSVDEHISSLAKRRSADFSKKMAMARRRKDQLEEMLGEVDSQLNKVKQKIRPS